MRWVELVWKKAERDSTLQLGLALADETFSTSENWFCVAEDVQQGGGLGDTPNDEL